MDSYSERAHQELIKKRLAARDNGFVPFELVGNETIPRMFDLQVCRHPRRQAIVSGGKSLTYEELRRVSFDISCTLPHEIDEKKAPVALLLGQHRDFVASMLGVLRSGGFYVPLDPSFPESRNSRILLESNARIVLTERRHQRLAERLASARQKLIYVDELESQNTTLSDASDADNLASVIFTSGSTGRPKGVVQTHRNLLQVVRRLSNSLCLGFQDRVSLLSSCSVTASVGTILGSLLNGATLCGFSLLEEGLGRLADWLDFEQITVYRSVPSVFRHLMESVPPGRQFKTIQIVRLGGDSLYRSDWELFRQHLPPNAVFVNFYGCSEISTVAAFYMDSCSQPSSGVLPVGYPLEDIEVSVIGSDGLAHSVNGHEQIGTFPAATGEIALRSRYLSPGYWNDPAATDAAFTLVDWTRDGMRSYRTGDLGALRENHGLVHLGREDLQVKISGFRVEIAEVEGCLRACPGVKEAAVVMQKSNNGEQELIGFVTTDQSSEAGHLPDTRSYVQHRLPAHMVPSEVVTVTEIPYTPNGKIDRAALTSLREEARTKKVKRAPSTRTEELLSDIWQQVLTVEQLWIDDNFFELSGNSLLSLKLAVKVSESFGTQIPIHSVYQYPTIHEMAQFLERVLSANSASRVTEQGELESGCI